MVSRLTPALQPAAADVMRSRLAEVPTCGRQPKQRTTSRRKDRIVRISVLGALALALVSSAASAQTTDGGYERALSTSMASVAKAMHSTIRTNLADSAARMTEADFAFRPTPEARSFGQLVGHVINVNYFFCSQAAGEQFPATANYETISDRATLVKALQDSLSYCDRIYDTTTDANFNEPVVMPPQAGTPAPPTLRGAVLMFNIAHNNEHYGNLVVYMRLRGRVPPSTARTQGSIQR
jgi:uncharacterized damage-inducible protein DinB